MNGYGGVMAIRSGAPDSEWQGFERYIQPVEFGAVFLSPDRIFVNWSNKIGFNGMLIDGEYSSIE